MAPDPGSTDDDVQGEKVVVKAGETSTVKLVVESQRGVIAGNVVDSGGEAIVDAYIVAARESDAAGASATDAMRDAQWSWGDAVITDAQGKFMVKDLGSGKYTVRAYRKGGGEAFAEHVAVGATVTLSNEEGQEQTYQIVGVDEANASEGRISWIAPLSRALLKAREGDVVRFASPAGLREIEVLEIRYE